MTLTAENRTCGNNRFLRRARKVVEENLSLKKNKQTCLIKTIAGSKY